MRIAIVGSRDYAALARVRAYVAALPPEAVVVSGGARGVDRAAADAARARGLRVEEYPPRYGTYGRAAPLIRNGEIVAACDRLVAFWDGPTSRGTAHVVGLALERGIAVAVYGPDGSPVCPQKCADSRDVRA